MTIPIPGVQSGASLAASDVNASPEIPADAGEASLFDRVWLGGADQTDSTGEFLEMADGLLPDLAEEVEQAIGTALREAEDEVLPDSFPILLARANLADKTSVETDTSIQGDLDQTAHEQPAAGHSEQLLVSPPTFPGSSAAGAAAPDSGAKHFVGLKNVSSKDVLHNVGQGRPTHVFDTEEPAQRPGNMPVGTVSAADVPLKLNDGNTDIGDFSGAKGEMELQEKLERVMGGSAVLHEHPAGGTQMASKLRSVPKTHGNIVPAAPQAGLPTAEFEAEPVLPSDPRTEIHQATPSSPSSVLSVPVVVHSAPVPHHISAASLQSERLAIRDVEAEIEAELPSATGASDRYNTLQTPSNALLSRPELPRQIAAQMAQALRGPAKGAVEITLQPEELGRVRMTISSSEAGITINVAAERNDTFEMMRRHAASLSKELISLGFDSVDLSFEQTDQKGADTRDADEQDVLPLHFEGSPSETAGLSIELSHRTDLDQTKALDKRI